MQAPRKIAEDLSKLSDRYERLQEHFSDFAEDVKEFFAKNGAVRGLTFEEQEADKAKRTSFIVVFVGMRIMFSFAMVKFHGQVTVSDVTNSENVDELMEWKFNGEAETDFKSEKEDQLGIDGGAGRHVFLHVLSEATKKVRE